MTNIVTNTETRENVNSIIAMQSSTEKVLYISLSLLLSTKKHLQKLTKVTFVSEQCKPIKSIVSRRPKDLFRAVTPIENHFIVQFQVYQRNAVAFFKHDVKYITFK